MQDNFDAIIIGTGIVACSIAFALSKRGLRTLNIDALPAAGYRSTIGSQKFLRTEKGIEEQP